MRRHNHEILLFSSDPLACEAVRVVRCRSLVAARATTKKLLAPHTRQTTRARYHQDARYLWTASIVLPGGRHESHEAERVVVPSVGELGWTP